MKIRRITLVSMLAMTLAACGGGGDDGSILSPGGGGPDGPAMAASVQVLASSPTLDSDQRGLTTVAITAIVRDANNVVLPGEPVVLSANANGSLAVDSPVTDANGVITAQLSNGSSARNRTITVTATAGRVSGSTRVEVVGTKIRLTPSSSSSAPVTMPLNEVQAFTATLVDSAGRGIPDVTLQLASAAGNAISAPSLLTSATGKVDFNVTATRAGADSITVSALEQSAISWINVSGTSFSFVDPSPAQNGEPLPTLALNTPETIRVRYMVDGAGVDGADVDFFTTRDGFVEAGDPPGTPPRSTIRATTTGGGYATALLQSEYAGRVDITALLPFNDNLQASVSALFVAEDAATLHLQAEPFSVRVGGESSLLAVVRDARGNPVANRQIGFSIINDATGGSLSAAQAQTDEQGRATILYRAGAVTSPVNGVSIKAQVVDTPSVSDTVNLTVSGQALAISLGTGNKLFEIGTATFAKEWVVFVTDADGNAVANKPVQVSVRSVNFKKGSLHVAGTPARWVKAAETVCPDEDSLFPDDPAKYYNGILDLDPNPALSEDKNNNGLIEAGNIAMVAAVASNAPAGSPCDNVGAAGNAANVVTGSDGRARVCIFYPQNYNLWLDARIEAKASVAGTEVAKSQTFELEALASHLSDANASPPGVISPFGPDAACEIPPPP
ncbi:MAG: Ig-like domain-containing protein [Gammaproteobacteria bacterium]|nr:Ig-like domain-containing protein [Gammaproteobacteria bacterium]